MKTSHEQERMGVMPLARELGSLVDAKPIPQLTTIDQPMRPSRGRWSPEQWAEMQAIYEGKLP